MKIKQSVSKTNAYNGVSALLLSTDVESDISLYVFVLSINCINFLIASLKYSCGVI